MVIFACVVFLMLISCITVFLSSTHNCPVKTVNLLTEGWKTQMPFCSEQQQCCFLLYGCAVFSFSRNVKLVFSTGSLSLSPNHSHFTGFQKGSHFPAYMAKKSVFLDSLAAVLISTPCSICCWAKRELSCAHLSRGPEGLCVCTPLDVMCVKLLFSEY